MVSVLCAATPAIRPAHMKTPIFGPFDVSRSTNFADNQLINLYPEIDEVKQGKAVGALYGTPGLTLLGTAGAGPIRKMQPINGALYVVSGSELYSVSASFAATRLGGGIDLTEPASLITNGTQLAVFSGATGWTWSAAAGFAGIILPFVPSATLSAAYLDGFGVVNQPGTALWFQSNLLDLTTWNALNFGDASGDPDNVLAIAQIEREMWLIKEVDTEIWYNAGTLGFTFARLDGVYLERGIEAIGSLAQLGDSLVWLSKNREGPGVFVQSHGHAVNRISTHSLETIIQGYGTRSDAQAYAYQQGGHQYYVCNFPSANATWCYDATASAQAGVPMWHQRAAFVPTTGLLNRHYGYSTASFNGLVIVGDYRNGNLYSYDLNALTDNGAPRKWLRTWRALEKPVEQPVRFSSLRIDMETGITVPAGTNPQVMLRWSDDGGHTWSNQLFAAAGATGQTAQRVLFRRLGATRRATGLDRIFELSSTDQFIPKIVGAELEVA
jgi:hypothetical protein